jgi:Flp pilus assembly protein TadB
MFWSSDNALLRSRAISGSREEIPEPLVLEKKERTHFFNRSRNFRRVNNFEKDYTALLVSLASAIRSGLDPLAALCQSQNLFQPQSEVSIAVGKFKTQLEKGVSEEEAIMGFASDIAHPDISLFRSSFILARKEGSSLGECLHRLARVTRQRQSFRRKIRAAVAMQKLSAIGISGCAIIIGIIQFVSNPKAVSLALAHPIGSKILMAGVGLIITGLVWMLNISRTRV